MHVTVKTQLQLVSLAELIFFKIYQMTTSLHENDMNV